MPPRMRSLLRCNRARLAAVRSSHERAPSRCARSSERRRQPSATAALDSFSNSRSSPLIRSNSAWRSGSCRPRATFVEEAVRLRPGQPSVYE